MSFVRNDLEDKGAQRGISSAQEVSIEEKVRRLGVFKSGVHQLNYDTLARRPIHSGDVIDWESLARQNLDQAFFNSIITDPFSGPQWGSLFRVNEPVYRELVREFFASFKFDASPYRLSRENATLSGLRNGDTVKESCLLMEFWPTIGDGGFNVGNTKGVRDKNLFYREMLVTKIARSFGFLTGKLRGALSVESPPHMFKKNSLIAMGVIMELQNEMCVWPAPRAVKEE
ncbi:hypothetical protein Tco_0520285 [Tanacetum coccineum]